ncbi:MAG: helicase-associated domain-containing protein [Peptococcaceae bacterium]|jgi:hypothetical protein|nr:helicase-associated domain-containing protein [Peptococcaceae bacterium]
MTAEQITEFLGQLVVGEKKAPGSLRHLAYLAGGSVYESTMTAPRARLLAVLTEYYLAPRRFGEIWGALSNAERAIAALHIWGDGSEPTDCADGVAAKFGLSEKGKSNIYIYPRNGLDRFKIMYADNNSKLWLLFPLSYGNRLFAGELRRLVGEMRRDYEPVSDKLLFFSRESRTNDFASIIRFCNANKVTVTKSGILSKSAALRLRACCGYEEYALSGRPEDARATDSLLVTFPLSVLCTIGGLLTVTEGLCEPGSKSRSLINLPYEQLVRQLFEVYLKSKTFDEISIIPGIKAKRGHHPFEARQNLVRELRYCPPGQAVYTKDFERYLRIANKTFARRGERYVVEAGSNYYNYPVEWEEYERPLISVILSFFCALGIIDVAWGNNNPGFRGEREPRTPVAFRVNQLGAYALGLSAAYAGPPSPPGPDGTGDPAGAKGKAPGGFTVLSDYNVVIPTGPDRERQEMYFEPLLTKLSSTDEAAIYRLDVETIIRVLDLGGSVADLRRYLLASDKPLPENVLRALDDWEKQAGRVKLRQVTILECDDPALLEEVTRYKGMGSLIKEKIGAAAVVDDDSARKIKKIIEKNKRFCQNII